MHAESWRNNLIWSSFVRPPETNTRVQTSHGTLSPAFLLRAQGLRLETRVPRGKMSFKQKHWNQGQAFGMDDRICNRSSSGRVLLEPAIGGDVGLRPLPRT